MQNIFAKISRKGNKSSNDSVNKLLSNLMWVLNIGQIMLRWRNEIREFCSFHVDCSNKLYNASHILFVRFRYFALYKNFTSFDNNICFFFFISSKWLIKLFSIEYRRFQISAKIFQKIQFYIRSILKNITRMRIIRKFWLLNEIVQLYFYS